MTRRLTSLGLLLTSALATTACEVKFDNQGNGRSALGVCAGSTMNSAMTDDASAFVNHGVGLVTYLDLAQSFVALTDVDVTEVSLLLRGNSPNTAKVEGQLRVELQVEGGGFPSGNRVNAGSYGELEGNSIALRATGTYTFPLHTTTRLVKNRKYWVRLVGTYGTDSPTFVEWLGTKNNPETQGQAMAKTSGGLWAPLTAAPDNRSTDLAFRLGCPGS